MIMKYSGLRNIINVDFYVNVARRSRASEHLDGKTSDESMRYPLRLQNG